MASQPTQTYNDGVCAVYRVRNKGVPGKTPVQDLVVLFPNLRYEERTVGMGRFWNAQQNNVSVDKVLRVPYQESISTQCVVILENGEQFDILQTQWPRDVLPRSMDLSLERRTAVYDLG